MLDIRCPQCGSENSQSISVLLAAGTSHGSIHGGGLSISQGGGLGAQSYSGATSQQTVLARKFTMGPRPYSKLGCLLFSIFFLMSSVVMLFESLTEPGSIFLVIGGVLGLIYISDLSTLGKRQERWDARARYLREAWFCHRCGIDWIPDRTNSDTTLPGVADPVPSSPQPAAEA